MDGPPGLAQPPQLCRSSCEVCVGELGEFEMTFTKSSDVDSPVFSDQIPSQTEKASMNNTNLDLSCAKTTRRYNHCSPFHTTSWNLIKPHLFQLDPDECPNPSPGGSQHPNIPLPGTLRIPTECV
ncbi:hypothetical protein J6590_060509 [Homalodisca vitripennis]|nr:hypothetical protein J6590_060509 [Homalodisca vitripennis]